MDQRHGVSNISPLLLREWNGYGKHRSILWKRTLLLLDSPILLGGRTRKLSELDFSPIEFGLGIGMVANDLATQFLGLHCDLLQI